MNGWINEKRSTPPDRWRIILDLGPKPGGCDRRQKWKTFRGTRKEAERHLRNLLAAADRGEFVEPSKRTLGEWLEEWLAKLEAKKGKSSPRTVATYKNAIRTHLLKSEVAAIRLQQLTPSDIEKYHHEKAALLPNGKPTLSHASRQIHQTVLSSALALAVRDKLIHQNVAREAKERPEREPGEQVLKVWTAQEAGRVLVTAKEAGTQVAAFVAFALDSGARKGELQALRWDDINLATGAIRINRQLLRGGVGEPVFGPTKTRKGRTVEVSEQTVALLREQRREQSELKLANRPHYADHGLVFAQVWEHQGNGAWQLGAPLSAGAIARMLDRLVRSTGVRTITVHGLRHTSATLLLAAGVQPHVVQKRLGHSNIGTTLQLYAHVLPGQQADAANRLAALLYREQPLIRGFDA